MIKTTQLDLISDDDGISSAPYTNSYHDLDMRFQKLGWNIDDDEIIFGTLPSNTSQPAFFDLTATIPKNILTHY